MKADYSISLKTPEEIKILRDAGQILATIIQELKSSLKIGTTTKDIETEAETLMAKYNVIPAFKGYRGFPGSVCISINEEVVHGIPGPKTLKEGDLVSLDVGIIHKNFYSDTAVTVGLGILRPERQKLLEVTEEALYKGIAEARANNHLSDISHAIQQYVEENGFSVVRDFVGHGIGRRLHEDPEIANFGPPHQGPILKPGMVFAIEPMVNLGGWQTKILSDGWTVVTQDGKPSAHFEHTIAITEKGQEILTQVYV